MIPVIHSVARRVAPWCLFAAVGLGLPGCASSGGDGSSQTASTPRQAAPGSYAFWPLFPDEPRIQFVRSINSSTDLVPRKKDALADIVFGDEVQRAAEVDKPYGVAMRDGKVYVCDIRTAALVVFDLPKKQTRLVGITGANRLSHPVAVAVADDGAIYVADNQRGAIIEFTAEERYFQALGFQGFKPAGVAVHGDRVYATDMQNQVVQVFDRRTGQKVAQIGSVGDDDGQFRLPLGIATDPSGNVYVMDMMRCRLQKFAPDGQFIAAAGQLGDYAGTFARPKHIAVDGEGIIYVVDAAFQNVQMFDSDFNLLMSFGAAGTFPGSMNLPAGVAVCEGNTEIFEGLIHPGFNAERMVLVTNQFGTAKVSIYAMGQAREGYTAADLARSAVTVSSGVGRSEEALQLQQQGTLQEPPDDSDEEDEEPESSGSER